MGCNWFSSETGIYYSKHRPVQLPSTPFLDVVSFIFSLEHNGVSAFVDSSSGFSIPYSKLQSLVKSMASGLHGVGISKGDVVLILLPNSVYFPVIFLGVLSIGAIATTMNPLSALGEVKKRICDSNASLVFTISGKAKMLKELGVEVVGVPENVESNSVSFEFSCFNNLILSNPNSAPKPIINQKDTAVIVYSSGTSGVSKGVVITHENLIAMVEHFVRFEASQYENPSSENVYLDTIPMFHIYGLSLFVMGLVSLGSIIVIMRRFDADEMVKAISKFKVTHFPVVPPILIAMIRRKSVLGGDGFSSLKQVSSGAAPVSVKIIGEFLKAFPHVDFIQGYGMTETTAVGTRGFNTEKFQKYSSIGLLAPNMQAKVVDWKTGSPLPPLDRGELWLRGPSIMKGYLNDDHATRLAVDKDGWLHTGDIAYFDEDGFLYIVDRLKEMIKYKGFQIAPADLEAVLCFHPEILDAAVTSEMDEEAGEIPVAFVVKRHGSALSQADVINYVAGRVAPYKKVRKVVFILSIPKSAAGKILRRQLRDYLSCKL